MMKEQIAFRRYLFDDVELDIQTSEAYSRLESPGAGTEVLSAAVSHWELRQNAFKRTDSGCRPVLCAWRSIRRRIIAAPRLA
jgi:hypothetical protein